MPPRDTLSKVVWCYTLRVKSVSFGTPRSQWVKFIINVVVQTRNIQETQYGGPTWAGDVLARLG